jgi:hypothetical protein
MLPQAQTGPIFYKIKEHAFRIRKTYKMMIYILYLFTIFDNKGNQISLDSKIQYIHTITSKNSIKL